MIFFSEFMLLWNKAEASSELTQASVETIAHELSHQWFGNLVTTSWWDTLFLNEGFATYFQHYLLNLVRISVIKTQSKSKHWLKNNYRYFEDRFGIFRNGKTAHYKTTASRVCRRCAYRFFCFDF